MRSPKLTLAIVVVLWIMALITAELVWNHSAEAGKGHITPAWFIELCKWGVGSALAALGVTAWGGWKITRKK